MLVMGFFFVLDFLGLFTWSVFVFLSVSIYLCLVVVVGGGLEGRMIIGWVTIRGESGCGGGWACCVYGCVLQ